MRWNAIHHLVVVDDDNGVTAVRGVVSDRDIFELGLVGETLAFAEDLAVSDVMTPLAGGVSDSATLSEAIDAMLKARVSALPVLRDDRLIGIVTETDLLRVLMQSYEDTPQEHDPKAMGQTLMSHPIMQRAMEIVAEAGI